MTYILSLAVNFLLNDYKGGGLAGAFQKSDFKLPHLVGTIIWYEILTTTYEIFNTNIPNQVEILNNFVEENFKNKSSALNIFSTKLIEANKKLSQNLVSNITEFYNTLDANVDILKSMEQTQMEDINKLS